MRISIYRGQVDGTVAPNTAVKPPIKCRQMNRNKCWEEALVSVKLVLLLYVHSHIIRMSNNSYERSILYGYKISESICKD